jgi:hypothetical protein
MKRSLFLSAIILISFSCNQKAKEYPKNADLRADNLNGPVKQTISTDYKVDSSGKVGDQDSCCVVTAKYDEKGYITEYDNDDKAGENKQQETFIHYDNGAMKSLKNTKNGNVTSSISVDVDSAGNYKLAQEYDSADKMKFYYTNISQNDYGQLTGMKKYNADSSFSGSMVSNFNNSVFTGNEGKDSVGNVTFSSTVKLDDKNNVVERDTKNVTKGSTINKIVKYKYDSFDDHGNWTQRTELDENGKPVQITKREITYYKE